MAREGNSINLGAPLDSGFGATGLGGQNQGQEVDFAQQQEYARNLEQDKTQSRLEKLKQAKTAANSLKGAGQAASAAGLVKTAASSASPTSLIAKQAAKGVANPKGALKDSTKGWLQQSWINLIDSFGVTLIYIDFHLFMSLGLFPFLSDYFCKMGEEWLPPGMDFKSTGVPVLPEIFGMAEIFLVVVLNLLVLILVSILIILIYLSFNPCVAVKLFGTADSVIVNGLAKAAGWICDLNEVKEQVVGAVTNAAISGASTAANAAAGLFSK